MINVKMFVYDKLISNCYVVYDDNSSDIVILDPFISEELVSFMESLHPKEVIVLLTHEHFDHTTGVNYIKIRFNAKLYCIKECAEKICQKRNNRPLSVMGNVFNREKYNSLVPYECIADKVYNGDFKFEWNGMYVNVIHTPGHTSASCCILIDNYAFCGDSALLGIPTITRFPSGSPEQYVNRTVPFLKNLNKNTIVMPGHGPSFKISEVKWKTDCFVLLP